MTSALLLALASIALIGAATPRQADQLFGRHFARKRRIIMRRAGFALLAFSLGLVLGSADQARALIGWVGAIGLEALFIALLFSARPSRSVSALTHAASEPTVSPIRSEG